MTQKGACVQSFRVADSLPPDQKLVDHEEISRLTYVKSIFDVALQQRLSVGTLFVEVIEAANLPAADFGGTR
jgi:hypothetical protein